MSRLRLYLIIFLLFAIFPIATVFIVNAIGFIGYRQTVSGSNIIERRVTKLDESDKIEILLLGDSSLNAAIDDRLFSELSGYNTVSLPLTGQWGYAGSLAILERTLDQERPATVILVHTADMFGRDVADFAYFLASDQRWTATINDPDLAKSVVDNLTSTKNFEKWTETWQGRWFGKDPVKEEARKRRSRRSVRDDLFQMSDHAPYIRRRMKLDTLNKGKAKYLSRIGAICQANNIRCLYAHGPIARPLLEPVEAFVQNFNPLIEQLGFELLPFTPVAMEYRENRQHRRPCST